MLIEFEVAVYFSPGDMQINQEAGQYFPAELFNQDCLKPIRTFAQAGRTTPNINQ